MPIKNFEKFEKAFYKDGKFDKKVFESYWGDPEPEPEYYYQPDPDDERFIYGQTDSMSLHINYEKLTLLGLLEYQDIVEKSLEWFETQISVGSYGNQVVPPLDDIRDYIIKLVGIDYKDYIDDNKLDDLSRFIFQEIDNYIFD